MEEIKIKPLNQDNFAPYGKLLERPAREPDADESTHYFWGEVVELESTGGSNVNMLEVKSRDFTLEKLEEHLKTTEMLVAIKDSSVLVVGVKSNTGGVERLDAFLLEEGQSVVLNTGTLHWLPFPLKESALLAVVFRPETPDDDLGFIELAETTRVIF